MSEETYNEEKFKAMLKYFIGEMPGVSLTKLSALCYQADFNHYEQHDRSISGSIYYKDTRGAIPDTIGKCLNELIDAHEVVLAARPTGVGGVQLQFYLKGCD